MKEINTKDAVGHVLCHDITQIVKDKVKGVAFKKGHVVKEEDIEYVDDDSAEVVEESSETATEN